MRFLAAMISSLALIVLAAGPAGAGSVDRISGTVRGNNVVLGRDGTCGPNPFPDWREGEMQHSVIEGTVVRKGPDARFHLDLCQEESGALGGTGYEGMIRVEGKEGTVTAAGAGGQDSWPSSPLDQFLTITGGTKAYAHAHGLMIFRACVAPYQDSRVTAGFFIVAPPDAATNGGPRLDCPV